MNSNVSKLLAPAPELSIGSTISLAEAERFGVDRAQLLRVVSGGKVPLYYRVAGIEGHFVDVDDLGKDPVTGGRDIPRANNMPRGAFESTQSGVLQLIDFNAIANVILVDALSTVELVAFVVPNKPERWFIPNVVELHPIVSH